MFFSFILRYYFHLYLMSLDQNFTPKYLFKNGLINVFQVLFAIKGFDINNHRRFQ